MTMTSTRPAHQVFSLETIGRATINGREWVLFSDGVHRHVVAAADFDRPTAAVDQDDLADAYTSWCGDAEFADDETAIAVVRELIEDGCHSAATLQWLDAGWQPGPTAEDAARALYDADVVPTFGYVGREEAAEMGDAWDIVAPFAEMTSGEAGNFRVCADVVEAYERLLGESLT